MKRTILLLMLALWAASGIAQGSSYLYIQGDKKLPFYVKLNGEMMPRYGKNYAIISNLAEGQAKLEFLFEQNKAPAQSFTILIPENGFRNLLLTEKDEDYSLYDLDQKFYILSGNMASDDRLPTGKVVSLANNQKAIEPALKIKTTTKADENVIAKSSTTKPAREPLFISKVENSETKPSGELIFLEDILLTTEGSGEIKIDKFRDNSNDIGIGNSETQAGDLTPSLNNSDCPTSIDDESFSTIYAEAIAASEDEERLQFLQKKIPQYCFKTWQARTLANTLTGDAARFSLLNTIYSRIIDQSDFPLLDDVISAASWKTAFQELIAPK